MIKLFTTLSLLIAFSFSYGQITEPFNADCPYVLDSAYNRIPERHLFASGSSFIMHKGDNGIDTTYKIISVTLDVKSSTIKYIINKSNRIEYCVPAKTIMIISGTKIKCYAKCELF